jgi:hypothetical protein
MRRNQLIEAISDPTKNFLASFLVGTLLFTIVSDGVTSLFWDKLGGWIVAHSNLNETVFQGVVTVGLVGILLGLTYFTDVARWLRSRLSWVPAFGLREVPEANVKPLTQRYRGLIVAMSPRDESPAEAAIRFHWHEGIGAHLEHCWLICTEKSLPYAQSLASKLAEAGMTQTLELHYGAYSLMDVDQPEKTVSLLVPDSLMDDPNYIQRLVDSIYEDAIAQANLDETEVIADYTGATKGMTAGILLACTRPERPLQYISQIQESEIMSINISYRLKSLKKRR